MRKDGRINTVIIPEANRADVEEIPDVVREKMNFVFAAHYDDVFEVAFPKGLKKVRWKTGTEKETEVAKIKAVKKTEKVTKKPTVSKSPASKNRRAAKGRKPKRKS